MSGTWEGTPSGPDIHTLTGCHAANALPEAERVAFEAHLRACDACAQEVRELRETLARLAGAVAERPPARLRERVFAEIDTVRQAGPPMAAPPPTPPAGSPAMPPAMPPPTRRSERRGRPRRHGRAPLGGRLAVAATVALLAVSAALGVLAVRLDHRLTEANEASQRVAAVLAEPDARTARAAAGGGGTGTVVVSRAADAVVFSAAGLPTPPTGWTYQLWLIGPSGARSAGLLRPATVGGPPGGGAPPMVAGGLGDATAVGLTIEPAGGSLAPTSAPIWSASLAG